MLWRELWGLIYWRLGPPLTEDDMGELSDMDKARLAVDATLDQWMASLSEQIRSGLVANNPAALVTELAAMFDLNTKEPQPVDIKAQPVIIMLGHAIHRLLQREAEHMADTEH